MDADWFYAVLIMKIISSEIAPTLILSHTNTQTKSNTVCAWTFYIWHSTTNLNCTHTRHERQKEKTRKKRKKKWSASLITYSSASFAVTMCSPKLGAHMKKRELRLTNTPNSTLEPKSIHFMEIAAECSENSHLSERVNLRVTAQKGASAGNAHTDSAIRWIHI